MQTWELLTSLASLEQIEQTLFVPAADRDEFERLKKSAIAQFDLNPDLVDFVRVVCEEKNATKEKLWLQRDKMVLEAADVLIPISLRKEGHMDLLLSQFSRQGKRVEDRFRVDYQKRVQPMAYSIRTEQLNPELLQVANRYLIHWTKAANSAWPTERLIDYYKAVVECDSYPRSAFCTLMNILTTRKIVATPKNMPMGIPTVSFSGLPPIDVVPLIRWRSRFSQMSFEPYGIGIKKEYAMSKGVNPVRYYHKNCEHPPDSEAWLWQSVGEKGDWRTEQEYRHKGDFDLTAIPSNRLLALCHTEREAGIIEKSAGLQAVSFLSGLVSPR